VYNPDTNRCYAEVVVTKNFSYNYREHPVSDIYRTTAVYDAQTKQILVMAVQDGDKSHANDFTNKANSFTSYDLGSEKHGN
jgi:glycosylphosphatidylinositol transamidase (GPIT) subunit GPI8